MSLNINKIWKYFIFNFKNLLKNLNFYVLFLLPYLFFPFLTIGTVEILYIGVFSGTLLISTIWIYGLLHYRFRLLEKQNKLNNKYNELIANFLLILFINFILFYWILFSFFILLTFSFLLNINSTFPFPFFINQNLYFSFENADWGIVFYYILLFTMVTYTMNYFISSFCKRLNLYLFFGFFYVILTIFYGGVPNIDYQLDTNLNNLYLNNQNLYAYPLYTNQNLYSNFYISQFIPVYFINQFCFYMFLTVRIFPGPLETTINLKYFNFSSLRWISLIFMPYIWILFYIIMGKSIKTIRKIE